MENVVFDYYYGVEAEQFSFYRIPRLLIKDQRFKGLSSDAKLLYGLMLDRMALSMKNGWLDAENKVYIHYTINDIIEDLGCARATCVKVLAELDSKNGIGLIEKKRQGQGKPDIIYVKNFIATAQSENKSEDSEEPEDFAEVQESDFKKSKNQTSKNHTSRSSKPEFQEVQELDFKKFKNQTSEGLKSELQEVQKLNPNYTNNNYTKSSNTNLIYPYQSREQRSEPEPAQNDTMDRIDKMDETIAYRILVRKNLEYDLHIADPYPDLFQEIYEIICDIVCINRTKVRISGQDYPYETVKSRFLKLNYNHVEYVMDCLSKNTSKIANIRAYLITALYNAPLTINSYYQQEVRHDMYGVG